MTNEQDRSVPDKNFQLQPQRDILDFGGKGKHETGTLLRVKGRFSPGAGCITGIN